MIWATVSSWSCFCWLYRASPSLTAKNIVNLISVLTIWWCPCVESCLVLFSSVQFSHSVVSNSLRPHESQHARPPCPSPTPGVHSNSRPSSHSCHPAISSSVVPFSSCPQSLPESVFSNESTLRVRWPKYWSFSFSISPSNEHPGLISFRMDWLDLLAVQGTLKSLGRGCLLWLVHFLGKILLVFALLHSAFQGQICLLFHYYKDIKIVQKK